MPSWWCGVGWGRRVLETAVADAVDEQSLIDLHGMLRPAEDIALYRSEMAEWPGADADRSRTGATVVRRGCEPTTRFDAT